MGRAISTKDYLNRQLKESRNIHQEPGYAAMATPPVFERQ